MSAKYQTLRTEILGFRVEGHHCPPKDNTNTKPRSTPSKQYVLGVIGPTMSDNMGLRNGPRKTSVIAIGSYVEFEMVGFQTHGPSRRP